MRSRSPPELRARQQSERGAANFRVVCEYSIQFKSSQVQISMAAAPAAFGAPAGARDREGAARRNWHGGMALSRGFIHIVRLLLERERYFSLPGPRGLLNCSVCNETHLNTAHSKTTPHSHTTPHSQKPHHTPRLLDSLILDSFTDFTDDTQRSVGLGMYAGIIHGRHLSISFLGWRAGLSGGSRQ